MEIILGSCLLAALVSGVVTIITSKKQNELKYITAERKKWREKIRDIARQIPDTNRENIGVLLAELKVRLNAYGYNEEFCEIADCKKSYCEMDNDDKDGYIWRVIKKIEGIETNEKSADEKEFEKQKKWLIICLSVLLKHDWERAKQEVNDGWIKLIKFISMIIPLLCFWGVFYCCVKNNFFESIEGISAFVIKLILFCLALLIIISKIEFDYKNKRIEILSSIQCVVFFMLTVGLVYYFKDKIYDKEFKDYVDLCRILVADFLAMSIYILSLFYEKMKKEELENEYIRNINRIKENNK